MQDRTLVPRGCCHATTTLSSDQPRSAEPVALHFSARCCQPLTGWFESRRTSLLWLPTQWLYRQADAEPATGLLTTAVEVTPGTLCSVSAFGDDPLVVLPTAPGQ